MNKNEKILNNLNSEMLEVNGLIKSLEDLLNGSDINKSEFKLIKKQINCMRSYNKCILKRTKFYLK